MGGIDWGGLYETCHGNSYKPSEMDAKVQELLADPAVRKDRGIYEYLLGGEQDTRLPNVRVFDPPVEQQAYNRQTKKAKAKGESNCPLCAVGDNGNRTRSTRSRKRKRTM